MAGLAGLQARHHIVFFERDVPYYAAHRDLTEIPGGELVLYPDSGRLCPSRQPPGAGRRGDGHFLCPDAVDATELVLGSTVPVNAFYDLDTPVTLDTCTPGRPVAYLGPRGLRDFDLVLSYTGGRRAGTVRTQLGRAASPRCTARRPEVHKPVPPVGNYRCGLSYLGTYAADRQATLERFFIEPARRLPDTRPS